MCFYYDTSDIASIVRLLRRNPFIVQNYYHHFRPHCGKRSIIFIKAKQSQLKDFQKEIPLLYSARTI
jgi:hypothetical protein